MSKSVIRSIKNVANGYSSAQILVRNATSNDATGPTTYDMQEIADRTYSHAEFLEIMDMIDRRLNDKGKNWRHVAKALTLLDYLVRFGSENVVLWTKDNLYIVKTLREFLHIDETSNDQGAIIRVKAKELVALLRDDERLRVERELAGERGGSSGRRRRSRANTQTRRSNNNDEDYDQELQKAIDESKLTAEEDARRKAPYQSDEEFQAALRLSLEEEEMRKLREQERLQNQNLLDLNDEPQQYYATGYQLGYVPQQQTDIFGNPIQSSMDTGFLQNAYAQQQQQQQQQQQMDQNYQYQLQLQAQQQQAQQEAQQQYLLQQQLQAQQQQALQPLKTGSNNPFALSGEPKPQSDYSSLNQLQYQQSQPQQQQQQQPFAQYSQSQQQQQQKPTQPLTQTLTGSQRKNEEYSELNNLLASTTGIDTYGNTGELRIPAQHTKSHNFINSSGTGYRQESNSSHNPFFGTQYTGVASTGLVPAYTGYGFGNDQQQNQHRSNNDEPTLIDI